MQLKRQEIKINGQMTEFDNIHYAAIRALKEEMEGCRYLEIGVNNGNSALCVETYLQPKKMVLIDKFNRDQDKLVARALVSIGCDCDLHIIKGDSHDILPKLKGVFDLILVDGDHSPKGAARDLRDAYELLSDEGTMLFDDIDLGNLLNTVRAFAKEYNIDIEEHIEWKHGVAILRKKK